MPPLRRRGRPVARAAMVGGAAYYGGKKSAQKSQREADQEARIAELEAQQAAAAQPAAPQAAAPAGMSMEEKTKQLTELKGLLDAGVLTQEEFDAQKQKILNA